MGNRVSSGAGGCQVLLSGGLERDGALARDKRDPPTMLPSRVTVVEKQIEVTGEEKWLSAAIDTESKMLLKVDGYSYSGTDPVAAFLHRLTETDDGANSELLVDGAG